MKPLSVGSLVGLLAAMKGVTPAAIKKDRNHTGPIFETFVYGELKKQATWFGSPLTFSQYLDKEQNEVDFVLENDQRQIVGVEVKASATVIAKDFAGLRKLQSVAANSFSCGIVLYDGDKILPFGNRLFAAPFASLWS